MDLTGRTALVTGGSGGIGGQICRTTLQRIFKQPETVVSKLCTIGTPHGGIDPKLVGGVGDWIMKTLGPNGSDIFAPEVMRDYMLPEKYDWKQDVRKGTDDWDPRIMAGSFPPQRVLSRSSSTECQSAGGAGVRPRDE